MPARRKIAFLLCLMLSPLIAQGQEGSSPENDAKARALFEKAEAFYKVREYEKALLGYKEAYLLSLRPELLFNIGQCHRFLEQHEDALVTYRTFLRELPDTPLRPEVEQLIAEVEAKQREAKATTQPSSTVPATGPLDKPAPVDKASPLPGVLYGAAAALGAIGLASGGQAIRLAIQSRKLEEAQADPAEIQDSFDRAKRFAFGSNIFLGAALISGGVGFLLQRSQKRAETQVSLSPRGVALSVRF